MTPGKITVLAMTPGEITIWATMYALFYAQTSDRDEAATAADRAVDAIRRQGLPSKYASFIVTSNADEPARATEPFPAAFDRAFSYLDATRGHRNLVLLSELRAALPQWTHQQFDAEVDALRRARKYSLDSADGRHERLTEEQRAGGIWEGRQNLVYAARR